MLPEINSPPVYPRIELNNLFSIVEWQNTIPWKPFKAGLEIHRLYGDGVTGAAAALLRCQATCSIPSHEHLGYEHILVLAGAERDQNSIASAGTLMINPPGSIHRVTTFTGSIVLAIWEAPMKLA